MIPFFAGTDRHRQTIGTLLQTSRGEIQAILMPMSSRDTSSKVSQWNALSLSAGRRHESHDRDDPRPRKALSDSNAGPAFPKRETHTLSLRRAYRKKTQHPKVLRLNIILLILTHRSYRRGYSLAERRVNQEACLRKPPSLEVRT